MTAEVEKSPSAQDRDDTPTPTGLARPSGVPLYAITIFVSAFLLFQVQPLIGRFILPWFGGAAGVWTTALMFFQVTLLIGYLYAHLVVDKLAIRTQVIVHLVLVGIAIAALPIIPEDSLAPDGTESPTIGILILLSLTVGVPYLVLSTSGPLLQAWFALSNPGRSPYRLYSLSNAGSLLALLSYPLIVERSMTLRTQGWVWSLGFVGFAFLVGTVAWRLRGVAGIAISNTRLPAGGPIPPWSTQAMWLALPAVATILLIAVTAQLTTDVSPIPLLWIVPLSIYLLSFILTFDSSRWYRRSVFVPLLIVALALMALSTTRYLELGVLTGVVLYSVLLFAATMSLHGELVGLKPDPRHLTRFYLMVALGGAIGGVFTGVVAPVIFDGVWEFHIALIATPMLLILARRLTGERFSLVPRVAMGAGIVTLALILAANVLLLDVNVLAADRSFYGVLRVRESFADDPQRHQFELIHGSIIHGQQFTDPERAREPIAYYAQDSGVGVAMTALRSRGPLRAGVVGLGAGTVAIYAEPGDSVVFYEIDPGVVAFADAYFTYLRDAVARGTEVSVLLGDGRLVLERQLDEGDPQQFDILFLDAFSGDAVPVHLLTVEAFAGYRQHLAPGGVIAFNVTNRYLDLSPVVRHLADEAGMVAMAIDTEADDARSINTSTWILLTDNRDFLTDPLVAAAVRPWRDTDKQPFAWTDDFSNLFSVLR